ncbi:chromosome partitioning protein ParA [Limosilactobacillus reuteri]|uniref:chromosome partitioning protein ParA n=1 Tax=Limosilactobacillus reuteri TaxID=1598 RepID=UPI00234B216B|nr:chromosome partitioning protein ParA [Limosilactobacillus reuteri]MDC6077705.1 chromosome partitioning protein ParA [Limosilactobacillus reuteri]
MEKTLKSQIPIKILTTANSNDLNKSSVVLIRANQIDTEKLVGLAEKANAKIHALVNYSGASDVLNLLQNLSNQGFVEGSYVFINIEDVGNINEIQSIYSNLRQGGYYVGLVNTVKGFASLDKDDVKNISFYKMIDQDGDNSITVGDTDGYINGLNIDLTEKLNKQPITRKERNTYTNVDVNTDSKGWVGIGQDTVLGGGKGFGYSTMGNDFNTVISPKGIIFRRPDAERMWELLKPKQQAEVSELLDHTVADEIKNQLPGLEKARQQADKAVKFAESAIAASKVNSDAIVAQSSAVVEAKSAMDSATAEIQQLKANAASDVAQIESTIAEVQAGVNQAKSANESAVQAVQAELKSTSDSMDKVEKQLNEVGTDLDTYAKSAAEQGHDITLIKQKQGQFEADFASAQGNVNQIQADIKGLRQNIKDNQGNIASLLTSADKLQASMTDAEKNISNLLLTASKYEQTFKDQDGRLSKVEQTAAEHTSELTDEKGNIDKVTQKADNLQLLLSDAQKNIQNIQLDAKGLHDTLTGQDNQLASLNVTLNNLDSKYSGITGDLKSKQTALSTEQQQTKDMLLNKADKSEVDSVKGTVNQVSAEQKTMADQISQKVSSAEYQTLRDKVNGMKIGTRNLLHHSDTFDGWNKGYSVTVTSDKYLDGRIAILGGAGVDGGQLTTFLDGPYNDDLVTWAVYAKADNAGDKMHTELWGGGGYTDQSLTTEWQAYKFSGHRNINHPDFYLWGCVGNKGNIYVALPFAVVGNYIGTWLANPDDTITAISKNTTAIDENSKLISLMAKQTDVDNIKGTAQQISSRLDVMADQIKSKVTSTDVNNIVDGKGYATTSTVQSLITQTAGTINESITNLDAKYNATVTQVQSLTASIDGLQSNVTNFKNDTSSQITQLSNVIQSKVSASDFNALKDEATWKSTDSIDLNTAVLQQKIFVKGGSNLPPGDYWWYVQVEPGYDSRIVQYAVSDRDNIHYSRQYDGSKWSAWSQGATESEITQLRDDINLRVKSGDLLSQINLTAGNTLIQSNKLYLDASSVVFSGRAFIPSAAIASLSADKINTGTLNTDKISLSNGHVRLSSDDDHFYVQTEENAVNNPTTRFNFDGIDFMDSSYGKEVPQYSIGYDTSSADRHLYINAFDHFNSGGTTASQLWYSMVPAISLNNQEINFAAKGNMHMQVVDGGVNIKPTLFFQNNTNNGTYTGFTRLDNSNTVEFNTGDNNGENFHVNSGARFMKYVYFNDYCRAQGWLTYSTLSKKTNIKKLDTSLALDKIRQDDQYLYEYKRNVAKGVYDPQASFIIDDVNDVSHYSVPREFIDQTGKYREPSVELSYLIAAFQEIDKQVQTQKEEIKELKEKLQHE